ncbi:MAG: peptidoglycan DD-metalloendopeptidase family protein [Alphaproteobacteria bacterium]|nr:peptidoglycan DD-metalloendopeptidase family protein [Alphaproteobacteria bacterium]
MSVTGISLAAITSLAIAALVWTLGRGRERGEAYWLTGYVLSALPLIVAAVSPWLNTALPSLAEPLEPVTALITPQPSGGAEPAALAITPGLRWDLVLLALWGAGAVLRGAIELRRSFLLHLRLRKTLPADRETRMRVTRVARSMTVSAVIDARTDAVPSPFVCGLLRPILVLPREAEVDDLVLAHELAHISRRDSRVLLVMRLAGLALWFNPFVFLIERERRLAVEIACDRAALETLGNGRARSYARSLLQAACANSGPQAALGFGVEPRKALEMRIRSILSPAPKTRSAGGMVALAALAVMALPVAGLQVAEASGMAADPDFTAPVVQGRTTSRFGPAAPGPDGPRNHTGHDIAAPAGTPVTAPAGGRVTFAGSGYNGQAGWGNVVEIDHGGGWTTVYAQLQDYAVAPGDTVRAGQVIARVGSSGVSTGPHLHVEVHRDGERLDPADYLPGLAPATPSDG